MRICSLLWAAFLVRCLLLCLVAFSGGQVSCQVSSGELGPVGSDGQGRNFRSLLGMVVPASPPPSDDDDDDDDDDADGGMQFSVSFSEDGEATPSHNGVAVSQDPPDLIASDRLRAAAFAADKDTIADVLTQTNSVPALIRGLQFQPQDRSTAVRKTADRESDPDVAVMKGLAQAALEENADIIKLAQAMSGAVTIGIFGGIRNTVTFYRLLKNRPLMMAILRSNAAIDFLPATGRRRLQCDGCTPVNSFVCASCWAADVCSPMFWCP